MRRQTPLTDLCQILELHVSETRPWIPECGPTGVFPMRRLATALGLGGGQNRDFDVVSSHGKHSISARGSGVNVDD